MWEGFPALRDFFVRIKRYNVRESVLYTLECHGSTVLAVSAPTSHGELAVWRTRMVGVGWDLGLETPLGEMRRFTNPPARPPRG